MDGKKIRTEETTPLLPLRIEKSDQHSDKRQELTKCVPFLATGMESEEGGQEKMEHGKEVLSSPFLEDLNSGTQRGRNRSTRQRTLTFEKNNRQRSVSADLDVYESNEPQNGRSGTVFLLLNTMIGSGILNQPQVFSEAGIVGTLLLYALGGYSVHLGLILLIEAGLKHHKLGFTEVSNYAFGRKGDIITDLAVIFSNFGGLLSYLTVVGGQICVMLKDLVGLEEDGDSWYVQEFTILPLVTFLVVLPLCLTRQFGHFVFISYLSITAISAVTLCVLIAGPSQGREYQSQPLVWISMEGMMRKFGSVVFALACAYAAFHAFVSMESKHQSTGNWGQVTFLAVIMGGCMCMVTGLAGYINFREGTDGDILDNFEGPNFYFFKVLLVVHLILYIPLDFVVMRHSVCKLFGKDAVDMPTVPYSIITVGLLSFTAGVVLILFYLGLSEGEAFGHILDITGGVSMSLLGFVMPGAIYMKLTPDKDDKYFLKAKMLMIWGIIVMIIVPVATMLATFNDE